MTLADLMARYEAVHGVRPARNTMEKLRAMLILNPSCECPYCNRPLSGGADTEFDHKNAGGRELRVRGISSRIEIADILANRHPDVANRQFLCCVCNQMKADMSEAEWLASPMYAWVSKRG